MAGNERTHKELTEKKEDVQPDPEVKQFFDAIDNGADVFVVGPAHRDIADYFTEDNIIKFLAGEITFAQLQGMTMEEAYGLAAHGHRFYRETKYHEARTVFEGLVVCNPYDSYFHTMLGAVYQELDMVQESVIEYTTAIDLNPGALHAYVNRARVYTELGKLDEALTDLEKAVALDPNNKDPATLRARALAGALAKAFAEAKEILAAEQSGQSKTVAKPEPQKAAPAKAAHSSHPKADPKGVSKPAAKAKGKH